MEERCEECLLPQKLCNDLQSIVYEENIEKRREMAQNFRKEFKEFIALSLNNMTPSEIYEGENSSLHKTFKDTIAADYNPKIKVQMTFEETQEHKAEESKDFWCEDLKTVQERNQADIDKVIKSLAEESMNEEMHKRFDKLQIPGLYLSQQQKLLAFIQQEIDMAVAKREKEIVDF